SRTSLLLSLLLEFVSKRALSQVTRAIPIATPLHQESSRKAQTPKSARSHNVAGLCTRCASKQLAPHPALRSLRIRLEQVVGNTTNTKQNIVDTIGRMTVATGSARAIGPRSNSVSRVRQLPRHGALLTRYVPRGGSPSRSTSLLTVGSARL